MKQFCALVFTRFLDCARPTAVYIMLTLGAHANILWRNPYACVYFQAQRVRLRENSSLRIERRGFRTLVLFISIMEAEKGTRTSARTSATSARDVGPHRKGRRPASYTTSLRTAAGSTAGVPRPRQGQRVVLDPPDLSYHNPCTTQPFSDGK